MADPYLFLDVDGVINAMDGLNRGDWPDFHKTRVRTVTLRGLRAGRYPVRISQSMCGELASLPVDVHWATTWEDDANIALGYLTGLPRFPVACTYVDDDPRRAAAHDAAIAGPWKWLDIQVLVDRDPRPVIWLDDEDIPFEAGQWFEERAIPHLLIRPDENVGLTRAHISEIRAFLTSLGAPDAPERPPSAP
jgi:hypothetical protein